MKNIHKIKENIYITSDEEIKEGDSYIRIDTGLFFKSLKGSNPNIIKKYCKKIILTTDTELIKDGVQAIDDEFLEWFVKNPSCEWVEVKNDYLLWKNSEKEKLSDCNKIIIPKEEQKQHLIDMMKADEELGLYDETEHLLSTEANKKRLLYDKEMEKQQQGYSEEDMLKSFIAGIKCESNKGENFEQFIKQFKKK